MGLEIRAGDERVFIQDYKAGNSALKGNAQSENRGETGPELASYRLLAQTGEKCFQPPGESCSRSCCCPFHDG